jgi:hypothetical protein
MAALRTRLRARQAAGVLDSGWKTVWARCVFFEEQISRIGMIELRVRSSVAS